jgi:hypothetical protein
MAELAEAMKGMQGVGEKEQYRLASYLERNKIRGGKAMEEFLYSEDGFMGKAKELDDSLDEHGKEMLGQIADLFKDSVGKSASETRDILTKMKVVQKTLSESGDKQSKQLSELIQGGGIQSLEKQGSLWNVSKDIVRGKVAGFKDKMTRKIPLVGGLAADIFRERKRRKVLAANQKAELELSEGSKDYRGAGASGAAPAAAEGDAADDVAPAADDVAPAADDVAPAAGEKPKKKGIAGKIKGMLGIRKKSPEEKVHRRILGVLKRIDRHNRKKSPDVKVHFRMLGVLKRIDKNTRRKKEDKLDKRESVLEKLRKSKPVKSVTNFFSGGGDSIIDDIFGTMLGGGLGGILGSMAGGLVGFLTAGLGALGGLLSFITPIILPLLAVAIVGAAAWTLGQYLAKRWKVGEGAAEGAELGAQGQSKPFTTEDEFKTRGNEKVYEENIYNQETGQYERRLTTDPINQQTGMANTEFTMQKTAREGIPRHHDPTTEAYQEMISGDLTSSQFIEKEKEARRQPGEGPSSRFVDLYDQVLSMDEEMKTGWAKMNKDYEQGRLGTEGLKSWIWADLSGKWHSFVMALVSTNSGVRDGILQAEKAGVITPKEADALFNATAFIGRDWEPQHNTVGLFVDDPTSLSSEYNLPGAFSDLNLGDSLEDKKLYPDVKTSVAGEFVRGEIPQLRRGGLTRIDTPAMLHKNEVVVPLSAAMVPQTGTLSEPAKLFINALMGNAIIKGETVIGGSSGLSSPLTIAPVNTTVASKTENIFSGAPITRNSEPAFREMQKLLYA